MTDSRGRILVIDDDPDVLMAAKLLLKRHYGQVVTDGDPEHLCGYLERQEWDLILLDMNFSLGANSGQEGLQWLDYIQHKQPGALVVLMTAYGAVDTAVQALKRGAIDFVLKPWQNERLLTTVAAALRLKASHEEVKHLKSREREIQPVAPPVMIGQSSALRQVRHLIAQVARTDANVLILGENGSGKEVAAREIHAQSARAGAVLISVDLGAVPESLFESEMFGHRKGAFTGATSDRIGRLQAASGGTLFLDEIGNLPLHLQAKLLSVLEQREVLPVGANRPVPIDVRLICASNKPLRQMLRDGSFREDLLYRINTVEIVLPPLRERREDIGPLLEHYIEQYSRKYSLTAPVLSPQALARARAYAWPGNIRELRHAVERAVILNRGGALQAEDLLPSADHSPTGTPDAALSLDELNLEQVEKRVIEAALKKHAGNISHAASELGITRTSLYRRMEKYGL